MKVLYDISVLGKGFLFEKARTGIFRVVENLAEELIQRGEMEIKFTATKDLNSVRDSIVYLNQTKKFNRIKFSKPRLFERRLATIQKKETLLSVREEMVNKSFLEKAVYNWELSDSILHEKIYYRLDHNLIDPRDLNNFQIYHSPFNAFPEQIKNHNNISKFLTCYDLIPILYPNYSEEHVTRLLQNILDSIDKNTWVLCISESTRTDLLSYMGSKIDPGKVRVTELAASNSFYKSEEKTVNAIVRKKYKIPDGPYILSLCTFEPRKNIDQIIRAFVKLINETGNKDLNLVLVGTVGWKFEKIFDEIYANKNIKDRILVTGFVPDEDLAPIYSDALVFVYPSFYEGFGLPPLEAMKCGVPVITSNTSSLPEVVGDAGILVSPTDLDALCQSIQDVYSDSQFREQLAKKSLIQAEKFSWKRCAEKTASAYQESLI